MYDQLVAWLTVLATVSLIIFAIFVFLMIARILYHLPRLIDRKTRNVETDTQVRCERHTEWKRSRSLRYDQVQRRRKLEKKQGRQEGRPYDKE